MVSIAFSVDYLITLAFIVFINSSLKIFPDISVLIYLLEAYHGVGIIFCILEQNDIREFV